jgi:hypothetical protein
LVIRLLPPEDLEKDVRVEADRHVMRNGVPPGIAAPVSTGVLALNSDRFLPAAFEASGSTGWLFGKRAGKVARAVQHTSDLNPIRQFTVENQMAAKASDAPRTDFGKTQIATRTDYRQFQFPATDRRPFRN